MAANKKVLKKDASQLNWKRKKWHAILAPENYGSILIGETMALDPKDMVGRTIEINLMHLTRNMKKQNVNATFKIIDVQNGQGLTKSYAYVMQPASIKRLVRAGRDRVDESFIIKSKDGVYGRMKPLFITFAHQSASERTKIRRASVSFVRKYAAEKLLEELFKEIVDGKLQKELNNKIRDFTRLKTCEVRTFEVIDNFSALKQRKLEKRQERDSKRLELDEIEAKRRLEEKTERDAVRALELEAMNAKPKKAKKAQDEDEDLDADVDEDEADESEDSEDKN
jgi:small subunit ribosomal protein S3Ae